MALYGTAVRAVQQARKTFVLGLPQQEQAIGRAAAAKGVSGGLFVRLVDVYRAEFEALAQECIDREEWLAEHSLQPGWWWAKKWVTFSVSELDLLHDECLSRLNAIYQLYPMATPEMIKELHGRLLEAKVLAGVRMEIKLLSAKDEATSASARKALSWFQRGVLFVLGWAAHALAKWLHVSMP